ncbi:MAG: permease-like cell division protein FtsX [Gammaproteobacteria bacterium]|jgi:cell division transport system permease protein|nr:permease-like cell division protein FtsX [Gammaproteobacteria bacterium]
MSATNSRKIHTSGTKNAGKTAKLLESHRIDAVASLRRIRNAPLSSFMTVFVIAVALLLPALLYALNTNLLAVLQRFQHETRITLFLLDSLPDAQGRVVSENLLTDSAIDSVEYISADQALDEFSASSGFTDIVADLETNPLPATIIITVAAN